MSYHQDPGRPVDRRRLLEVIGSSATVGFAGCFGDESIGDDDDAQADEGNDTDTESPSTGVEQRSRDTPPTLQNLGVDLDWDGDAFDLRTDWSETDPSWDLEPWHWESKVFREFGAVVRTGPPHNGVGLFTHFDYLARPDADVISPIDGVVQAVEWQPGSEDYSFRIEPVERSDWHIDLDHCFPVGDDFPFSEGDPISAGELVGRPGNWDSNYPSEDGEYGRLELMIGEAIESGEWRGKTRFYCPFDERFWDDESLRQEHISKVQDFMDNWEELLGVDIYRNDPIHGDEFVVPGCRDWEYVHEEVAVIDSDIET